MKAQSIANSFLNKVPVEAMENNEGIHKVKLQKLLFLAQEEYLFRYGKPLFGEKIEAWEHGPVVREVWNEYAELPYYIINIIPPQEIIPEKAKEVVDYIWSKYGEKDTWYLRDLTHSYKIWKDKRDTKYNGRGEISIEEILQYKKHCESEKAKAREYIENLSKEFLC